MKKLGCGIFLATILAGGQMVYGDVIIDDFSDGLTNWNIPTPDSNPSFESDTLLTSAIGGTRYSFLQRTAGTNNVLFSINASSSGYIQYQGGGQTDGDFLLGYGTYDTINGLSMNANLTPGTEDTLRLSLIGTDSTGTGVLTLFSSTGPGTAIYNFAVPDTDNNPGFIDIPFSDVAFAGFALGDVDGIQVSFNPGEAADWTITSMYTTTLIPETSSIVMGIGLLGALGLGGVFGRRKQKKTA